MNDNASSIIMMVKQIPLGRVATYGQIAKLAGIPNNSRQVGSVLRRAPSAKGIPWFRVVNAKGEISSRGNLEGEQDQRGVLEDEGVEFDENGRINLERFQWQP